MTTVVATSHVHPAGQTQKAHKKTPAATQEVKAFFTDLKNQLLHEAGFAPAPKGDLFRDHVNAMAICYFAIIVAILVVSLPVLAYWVNYSL